jgi:hypothetical protein
MICSHSPDIPYLDYCFRSIRKFARLFNSVVLVVGADQEADFAPFKKDAVVKTYVRDPDPAKHHLHHQAIKCQADKFCNADYILHTDSDCVFTETVTPFDYFEDRKPVMLIEEFKRLPDNPWKEPTERALGWPVAFETMRRHPQVNSRRIYGDLRERVQNLHKVPFEQYVLAQKPNFPWGFSEHCAIGAYALHDPFWRGAYHWITLPHGKRPPDKLLQCWSHSPVDKPQGTPFGLNLTPLEVYQKIGL